MIILFDLDGTLIDSTEAILESFHNALNVHAYPQQKDEDIKALIGHPLDVMFSSLGVSDEKVWDFVKTYKEHYRKISTQKTILLDSAEDAIKLASEFATLGIVTTKTGEYSEILMRHFGVMDYFEVLIGREHVENPKPHAEPILKALEKLECSGKEIWMIGDTRMDLVSAQNAGVNSIGVLSGYDTKEELGKYTEIVLKDALECVKYLKNRKI